ncbi:isoprenylcysteine carboxylmethyltransferase family protein [Blastopirellula sp. JC732]|uniref:methanethiol S-methyltransferase n=1 Tax=Blastopirellula sediminis TaxID=2894196 RepID=A0A9X1SKP6_9BACT|nr:methanethiol S-methyltransferase [Blastopirellula sediminis]MCC9606688.1 isoprenylcysteine carboxylmethyltransferase family protein [Blastopirellula sediminis]MCC9630014.1 isoprenylcysteine carboxylmethyltransferase family protein [Blastopirellula sediminis]
MAKRIAVLLFGALAYVTFLGVFLYSIGFIGNLWVPRTIDAPVQLGTASAIAVNLLLIVAFGIQHSGMARPAFKRWLTQYIPKAAERSLYVMTTNILMIALFLVWQPMPQVVWHATSLPAQVILYTLYGCGWGLIFFSSCLINHFDLFGMRQSWLYFRGVEYTPLKFQMPVLYRYIRHPLYVGWFLVFWMTPTMSVGHLLFAIGTTVYILAAIPMEERDLVAVHGSDYEEYRRRVRMFIPKIF